MTRFCPDCNEDVPERVEDNSFDHEFGTQWCVDYYCYQCDRLLHTAHSRPRKEVEEP